MVRSVALDRPGGDVAAAWKADDSGSSAAISQRIEVAGAGAVERIKTTVRWVEASSTSGGTAATMPARMPGTVASAATRACAAFAVTDTKAPAISSAHGYHAARCRSRATTATVATTTEFLASLRL